MKFFYLKKTKRRIFYFAFLSLIFLFIANFLSYRLSDFLFEDNFSSDTLNFPKEEVKLTIIIDDIGRSFNTAKKIWDINKNITLSILPFLKYSRKISEYAKENHLPAMLHFPMEPINYRTKLESFFLLTNMNSQNFYNVLNKVLNSIPYYQGINNHMGSKFTSDYKSLKKFFDIIKFKNVFFIDSITSPSSIAAKISIEEGILTGVRDIFLDNKLDVKYILNQLDKLYNLAEKKGYAIAIGHPHKETIEALKIFFKNKKDVKILSANKGLKYFSNYEKALVFRKEIH